MAAHGAELTLSHALVGLSGVAAGSNVVPLVTADEKQAGSSRRRNDVKVGPCAVAVCVVCVGGAAAVVIAQRLPCNIET